MASSKDTAYLPDLKKCLIDKNPVVRYWAAVGCTILSTKSYTCKDELIGLLEDEEVSVRIAAAEALYLLSEKQLAVSALGDALKSQNPMARVLALNVLENMGTDARPALEEIRQLLKEDIKDSDYDVRAAKRILENI
jgi:HEAT repeat protein